MFTVRPYLFLLLGLPFVALGQRAAPPVAPQTAVIESSEPADRYQGGLVVRRGVAVEGMIDGALVVVDEAADVSISNSARLKGDLVLPREKDTRQVGAPGVVPKTEAKLSSRLRVDQRSLGRAEPGRVRASTGFDLPRVIAPVQPVPDGSLIVQSLAGASVDFSKVGDITLRKAGATVAIPPGHYGRLTVANGTVILGTAGASEPVRYEFRSIEVQAGSRIEAASPVIVTVAAGSVWRGMMGNPTLPLLLDLRVAREDVTIAGTGSFHGFLTASESKVSVARGGVLTGGAICDRLEIAAGATVQAVEPDWSNLASERTRPRFPHKALRLHSNIPDLQAGFRYSYYPGISYVEDVPYLMLAEGKRPRSHPLATYEERLALLEACRALFEGTGFDRGGIVLADYSADKAQPATVRNVILTRQQFDALFQAYEERGAIQANGRPVSTQMERVDEFYERCLAVGLSSATAANRIP